LLPIKFHKGNIMSLDTFDNIGPSSSTVLFHRSVAFTISPECDGYREWEVFAPDGPIDAGNSGVVRGRAALGSFQVATQAAQKEIDGILDIPNFCGSYVRTVADIPPHDILNGVLARQMFEMFGESAAETAFNVALEMSAKGDDAEESRWLCIAIEVMGIYREHVDTVADRPMVARDAIAVR
jgi:hypothetical protein